MSQRLWSIEEDNYIKNNFGNATVSSMAKHIGCGVPAVQKRAEFLGLKFEKRAIRKWTEEEIELLKSMSSKYLNKTIAKKLNRTTQEINRKAKNIGITLLSDSNNNKWTEEEIKTLIELAPTCYIKEIAKVLNRTEEAVITKARRMGLEYITLRRKFSEEELSYIRSNWGRLHITEIARNLRISKSMIQRQANLMNLPKLGKSPYRKWTADVIKKLNQLAKEKTITELAKYFKTTKAAIKTISAKNSIDLIDDRIHWTDDDKKLLREYAKTMNLSEIANKMNRSIRAVREQAKRQKIIVQDNDQYKNSRWTEQDSKDLVELASQGKTILEITKLMNKKDQIILKKAKKLGIDIKQERVRQWTEEEEQQLIELAKTKKMSELVNELGRTSFSIRVKANKIGITIIPDRKNWTIEEYQQLEYLVMVEKKTPKEISKILDRTEYSIIDKIYMRGLKIQTNTKRNWTPDEEMELSDLWGSEPIEKIAKKLNRSVLSIKQKATLLGLGAMRENNYNGLTIKEISELLNVEITSVSISWISLGLKYKIQKISEVSSYRYVEIKDLYEFLEKNQNIWDSRNLEKNILGKEPEWLTEKRKRDRELPVDKFELDRLTKQQLIVAKKFFLENQGLDQSHDFEKKLIK